MKFVIVTILTALFSLNARAEAVLLTSDEIRIEGLRVHVCNPQTPNNYSSNCTNAKSTRIIANHACLRLGYKGTARELYPDMRTYTLADLYDNESVVTILGDGNIVLTHAQTKDYWLSEIYYGWIMPGPIYSQTFKTLFCER